jgi:UDP-N-acetylglucosamine 4,6-dehydratase
MFEQKTFLITGGTGSFGQTIVNKLLEYNVKKVLVFSRDEAKQDFMRQQLKDPRLTFILGDIRSSESVSSALAGVDYLFHAAALKQVPTSEDFPWEFVQTNIEGTHNLLKGLENSSVEKAVFLSTDKAVYPVNAMGMTKALMEKLVRSKKYSYSTIPVITRYGNVIGSRGSVIPYFIDSIRSFGKVKITNPYMTRFMMSLEESVDLVLFAFANGQSGDLFVQKSPAATVDSIVQALEIIMNKKNIEREEIGIRPGEKIHETLLTAEEKLSSVESQLYFQVKNNTSSSSNAKAFSSNTFVDYSSNNTNILSVEELAAMLIKNYQVKKLL